MRRARTILILGILVLIATSVTAFAQLATSDWPTFYHDTNCSGRSPATTIAKPFVKWTTPLTATGYTYNYVALSGMVVDAQKNVYLISTGSGGTGANIVKVDANGVLKWAAKKDAVNFIALGGRYWGGPAVRADGGVLVTPGWASGNEIMYCIDPTSGLPQWTFNYSTSAPTYDNGSDNTPTIAPDGSIYSGNQAGVLDNGRICAIKPDHSGFKWVYGGGAGETHIGQNIGAMPVKVVGGKNVIFASGAQTYTGHGSIGEANTVALRDDGTSAFKLWGAQTGYHYAYPCLSNDQSTLYQACFDAWQFAGSLYPETLWALNADTGEIKWKINTGSSHELPPAIGPDGTLYLTGGNNFQSSANPVGRLIAVTDNGTSATIKWTLDFPDDVWADGSNPVVISTNPTTIYVGTCFSSNTSRIYCIQDMGTYAKIVWTYEGSCLSGGPVNLMTLNDGTLYAAWGGNLMCFDTGYNPSSKIGLSGRVTDAHGNPVANAWVAASPAPRPLADNSCRDWSLTDANGYYYFAPNIPGTYYVAAWARGYKGSEDQVVTFDATTPGIADFTLATVGYNWAFAATASSNNVDAGPNFTPVWAVDGDLTTRWSSDGSNAANRVNTKPTSLTVDLGQNRTIDEVVLYFEYAYPADFKLECLADGLNPATDTWTVKYLKTGANGGVPLDYYTPANTKWKTAADVLKFDATSARYWRMTGTKESCCQNISVWEMEVLDAVAQGPVTAITSLGAAKDAADGSAVKLDNMTVTAASSADGGGIPANTVYLESADRSAAVRANVPNLSDLKVGFGDKMMVLGQIRSTTSGERFIEASGAQRKTGGPAIVAVGMNNRAAMEAKSQGMFVKLWGKVTSVGTDNFVITDGAGTPITVKSGAMTKRGEGGTFVSAMPGLDNVVRVRGVVSSDESGPVLLMRNESMDWANGDADYEALPLPGTFKYPREFLVCGPFADANSTFPSGATDQQKYDAQLYRLDHDFISEATGGQYTENYETHITPSAGDACGANVWTRADATGSGGEVVDFIALYPNKTYCTFYAHVYIWSPTAQDIAARVGSDDSVKVFVNGIEVWRNQVCDQSKTPWAFGRGVNVGADPIAYFPLSEGLNSVLIKVEQGTGGSGANIQFVDPMNMGIAGYGGAQPWSGLGYILNKTP